VAWVGNCREMDLGGVRGLRWGGRLRVQDGVFDGTVRINEDGIELGT
jgi:hypothetical protein